MRGKFVVPTIFALNEKVAKEKFEMLKFAQLIHLDICDGRFVSNETISVSDCLNLKNKKQEIEVHLMVKNPLNYLKDCKKLEVKRVFVHREIFDDIEDFVKVYKDFLKQEIEVCLVLNPGTRVEDSILYLNYVNRVMIMSVYPGAEGQVFIQEVLNKVRELRSLKSSLIIQIDGGINERTGREARGFGVDILCVGSFISSSENPKGNYDILNSL